MDTAFAAESETQVIHRNRFPYLFRGIKSLAPGQYPHGPPSTYHIYQHYRVTATACLFSFASVDLNDSLLESRRLEIKAGVHTFPRFHIFVIGTYHANFRIIFYHLTSPQ